MNRTARLYRQQMDEAALYNSLANDLEARLATEVNAVSVEILHDEIARYRDLARDLADTAADTRSQLPEGN